MVFCSCRTTKQNYNQKRAETTLDSIYKYYSVEKTPLLRETYPFDDKHTVTYLAGENKVKPNPYSYLWPYSGSLSAVSVLCESAQVKKYDELLEKRVLSGLKKYDDIRRSPDAYASYINTAPKSDRFYDDNIWIGIDFTDLYLHTKKTDYLNKAKSIWKFIESGTDDKLGGGIYWVEQKKGSKHTCSNAPAIVYAIKLFEATNDSAYLYTGKKLYQWTKKNLQDPEDYLYYDNVRINGSIDKKKYSYNSGQMLQAAALLYKHTQKDIYLKDAQNIAKSCYNYFFKEFKPSEKESFRLLIKGDVWFSNIMFRGFIELYHIDNNKEYINAFQKNLDYAWLYMRAENGLFNSDWSGMNKDNSKWLLTQFAMVEMYARISNIK